MADEDEYQFDGAPIMMLLDLLKDQGVEAFVAQAMNDIHTRLYAIGATYCVLGDDSKANLGAILALLADQETHLAFPYVAKGYAVMWKGEQNGN